jgi:hypothetical protein
MTDSFILHGSFFLIAPLMLIFFFLVMTVGYVIGKRHGKQAAVVEKREKTTGTITGAMLALLGFMLAITLSMSDSRFENRRQLVIDEANAVSTSSLRAQTIGGVHGTEIVRLLKEYTRLRLDFFEAGEEQNRLKAIYAQTSVLQGRIWEHASAIASSAPTPISGLLLSSLNETFDLATSRRWIFEVRTPPYIIKLLVFVSFLSMGMIGYYFGICGVYHPILAGLLFLAVTFIILLIMDLDRPRSGHIKPEQSPLTWLIEEKKHQAPVGPLVQ